jgi:hypothetical protein
MRTCWMQTFKMIFINLCGKDHEEVVLHTPAMGDQEIVYPKRGEARLHSEVIRVATVEDADTGLLVPLIGFDCVGVSGLPAPQEGVMLIVSKDTRQAFPERTDLCSPDVTSKDAVFEGRKVRSVPGFIVNLPRRVIK